MDRLGLRFWDSADFLQSEDDIAHFWETALHESAGDTVFITKAIGTILRARGIIQLASATGLTVADLRETLAGQGDLSFANITDAASALGLDVTDLPLTDEHFSMAALDMPFAEAQPAAV